MKIALLTDTHWGARNDSLSFLEYFHRFYDNVFFPYVREHNIQNCIHLGDIVDRRKYINFNTLRALKYRFVEQLRDMGVDFKVIIGNHDVMYRNTNEVNAMHEIFGDSDYVQYFDSPETIAPDGCEILVMPWINRENYADAMKAIKETPAQICFGHLEVNGHLMMPGVYCDHGIPQDAFKKFEMVCSGHFHHRNTIGNVTYLGCPYEMNWSDYNQAKGFHIFDTDTRELTFIRNPYKMYHKLWYDDEEQTDVPSVDLSELKDSYIKVIVQSKTNPYWFDMFMDRVYKADPEHVQIVDDHKNLDKVPDEEIVDEAEDTLTILNKYVDSIPDKEVDDKAKAQLSVLLHGLYNDAIHMEA